jgi:hypothetical protein
MSKNTLSIALCVTLALGLAACGDDAASVTATATGSVGSGKVAQVATAAPNKQMGPVETTLEIGRLAKSNDIKGLLALSVPGAEIKKMADNWESKRKEPLTDANRKEFADGLAKLLAPGAIDELMAQAEPQLAQLKPQMPLYVGMGVGFLQQGINANGEMTEEQKKQAVAMVGALQTWAGKTDLTDPNRLRKALTELASGVRATNITTLDQMQALSFDQVLGKGGVMFGALKKALNVYDLNMDQMLSSVKAQQVSMTGDTAVIKSSMTFLGQEFASETPMVKVDGRWYSKGSIDALKKATESMETPKAGG